MRLSCWKGSHFWAAIVGLGLALSPTAAYGQHRGHGDQYCPPPCAAPGYTLPPAIGQPVQPIPGQPVPAQPVPGQPAPQVQAAPAVEPMLGDERFGALASETVALADSAVGYIDSAIPATHFRVRVDAAYNNRRPDRAEFFYAKCGCFRILGLDPSAGGPPSSGPPVVETSVDYQDASAYLEVAASPRFSAFVELPVRFINPDVLNNTSGLADMNAGFKWAFQRTADTTLTFQFKAYAPTGDADRGLGTDHPSVEPGILLYRQLSDRSRLEGELRYWIPINGTDFAGEILRYGLGLSCDVVKTCDFHVSPVVEVVGWTVLDGFAVAAFSPDPALSTVEDAEGDTIVNAKIGIRIGGRRGDVYAGYGRALTGDNWYEEVYRLEFRLFY
jgi:hypothetical protein